MNPELITLILNIVFFAFLIIGFLTGLKGLKKATSSLISFLATTIVVLFLAVPVSTWVLGIRIGELTIQQHISDLIISILGEGMATNETVVSLANSIPVLIVSTVVCIVLVLIVGLICKIITSILYRIFFGKNKERVVEEVKIINGTPQMTKRTIKENKHRFWGGLIGTVHGLLLAIVLFMPLIGLINIVNDVAGVNEVSAEVVTYEDTHKYYFYPTALESEESTTDSGVTLKYSNELLQEYLPAEFYDYARAIDNSFFAKLGKIGNLSENTLNIVAKCDLNGQTIKLGEELRTLVAVYDEFVDFATETSNVLGTTDINVIFNDMIDNPNNYNFEKLYQLSDNLFKSNLIKALGNDALSLVCDVLIEQNTNVDLVLPLNHLKTAVQSYDACGYTLQDDLKVVLQTFELSAKNGLIKAIKTQPFDIHNIANVLLNEPDAIKGQYQNLSDLTEKISSSNLLQKIVLEATNYGTTCLQDLMNEKISFNNEEQVVLPKINSTQNIRVSSNELFNITKDAYSLYNEYENLDIDKIQQDFLNIFDYDVKKIVTSLGQELNNIVNMSLFKDTGIFANICEAMQNSEYGEYFSFDELAKSTNLTIQFTDIATSLDELKNSNIITNIRNYEGNNTIDLIIDELATLNSANKTLATRIVAPILNCPIIKNTLIYGLNIANDNLESGLQNMTENAEFTLSKFNTSNVMTTTGNQELMAIINNLIAYLKDVSMNDLIQETGANDKLVDTIIASDLPTLGVALDSIKNSTLFSSNGTGNGAYKDMMLAFNQTDLATVFDFETALADDFSWTQELTTLDATIDSLNTIKIGDVGLVTYMINNTDFDAVFDALKLDINKDKIQTIKAVFDITLIKPLAVEIVNSVNSMIKDFVGETFGTNIVDIDKTINLKSQSQQIVNVLEKALDVDFTQTKIDDIDQTKLNLLLDAMENNANSDGVFKQSYNALLLKIADMINESTATFVGAAGSNITRITAYSDVLTYSQGVRSVLNTSISSMKALKDKDIKDLDSDVVFALIDSFKNNSKIMNNVFKNTYNAILVYIVNIVNSEIANYVGTTFAGDIQTYTGATTMINDDFLIRNVILQGITVFSSIPEGKELKDVESETLKTFLNALNYLGYTKPARNALNNKLANIIIESINDLTGDSVATLSELKDLNSQADDIFNVIEISLQLVPVLETTGLKVTDMTSDVKTAVAGFMNAMQVNSIKTGSVLKASYDSLLNKVATENGTTSEFIYANFATNGIIDWSEFMTSI